MMWFAIASAAMSVIGKIQEGNQAAKVAGRNASLMDQRAAATLQANATKEDMLRERNRQTFASQRAALGQNGVDPTTGSALIGMSQNMRDADLDALMLRHEGLLEAHDLKTQADMTRWEGKAKKKASRFGAAQSIIGAAGSYIGNSGWGTKGPGFSGQQSPAPVETRSPYYGTGGRY